MQNSPAESKSWTTWLDVACLVAFVLAVYLSRLTTLPIRGEESRWARQAVEMIESGDWIVPRHQGRPFPDRPPLATWAIAVAGLVRGEVDLFAVRFPSVLAMALLAVVIYAYGRNFLTRFGALASAVVGCTFALVLEQGREGESDALLVLCFACALFGWHTAYLRGWPKAWMWIIGYGFAALGAMSKGPQAPVYFAATVTVFLALRREWRTLFSVSHLAGLATLFAIIGPWWCAFYQATSPRFAMYVFTGPATVIGESRALSQFGKHLVTYPFAVFACLLPWSPLMLLVFHRTVRTALGKYRPQLQFLATAMVLAFPSVWFAAMARGRHYMALTPCFAVWIGMIIERCATAEFGTELRQHWSRIHRILAAVVLAAAIGITALTVAAPRALAHIAQPLPFLTLFVVAAAATAGFLVWSRHRQEAWPARAAFGVLSAFVGLAYTGLIINTGVPRARDLTPIVAEIKQQMPNPEQLVSFGPVFHRFSYYYGTQIRELPWPQSLADVPEGVTHFCCEEYDGKVQLFPHLYYDSNEKFEVNDELPFAWRRLATIPADPRKRAVATRTIVLGEILRTPQTAGHLSSGERW